MHVLEYRSRIHERTSSEPQDAGLLLACTESPDVIITDIMMPRGSGEYLVECLKRNMQMRNIPAIVLSGAGVPRLEQLVRHYGVDRAFAKPVEFSTLYRAVEALAPQHSAP